MFKNLHFWWKMLKNFFRNLSFFGKMLQNSFIFAQNVAKFPGKVGFFFRKVGKCGKIYLFSVKMWEN